MKNQQVVSRLRRFGTDDAANAMVEFALVLPAMAILLFGTLTGSMALDRYFTVLEVARSGGLMYSRGVDFTAPANENLLKSMASPMLLAASGGDGVVYLTRVTQAATGSVNGGNLVATERIVIGTPSIKASEVAVPDPSIWPDPDSAQTTGAIKNYDSEASAVATMPSAFTALPDGEFLYVAEVYWRPPALPGASTFWSTPTVLGTRVAF